VIRITYTRTESPYSQDNAMQYASLAKGIRTMQVWQHLDKSDHLRRRAEGMIDAARKNDKKVSSAAANGYRLSARDARKLEMRDDVQVMPGLLDTGAMDEKK